MPPFMLELTENRIFLLSRSKEFFFIFILQCHEKFQV